MINSSKLIVILMLVINATLAQSSVNSLREVNKKTKIALTDIIGNWYGSDSLKSKISFINDGNYSVYLEGINHGVGNYSFTLVKDSLYVNVAAPNWPPYDCTLSLLNINVLEIKFYQYFSEEARRVVYRRK